MKEGDRLRLVSVAVTVATDEQIAKGRAKAGDDLPVRARLEFELEPLSFRFVTEDGSEAPAVTRGFVDITKGKSLSLTPEEVEAVRQRGIMGIPPQKVLNMRVDIKRPVDKYSLPIQRFLWHASKAGIKFLVSGTDAEVPSTVPVGQLWTSAIGQVLVVSYGYDSFPMNNEGDTYDKRLYYFIALDPEYVAPPMNEREVRIIRSREDNTEAAEATTTVSSGPTAEVLRAAAQTAGIIGRTVSDMTADRQVIVTNRGINAGAPVLGHPEVQAAVDAGQLVEYLVEKGAVSINSDGEIV